MRLLADINVWVALAIPNHFHRPEAVGWFDSLTDDDVVYFCRVTQQGYLRLVTTTAAFGRDAVSNNEAWGGYLKLRRDFRVQWLDEPEGLESLWVKYANSKESSPKDWMDAYLAAMATLHGVRFVTFDQGFAAYRGLDWFEPKLPR
jgi:toxin-antitoxin system PIN domain toxin